MSEISELILLLNKQHQEQMTVLRDEHREQNKQHQEQMAVLRDEQNKQHQEQMTMLQEQLKTLQSSLNNPRENVPTPMASFQPFDSTSELWTDYLARFRTFVTANSIPDNKQAQIFLTNQSNSVYKMLSNLAAQQQPVKSIHELTMNDIQTFMAEQFDPKRFVVRERFKFWSGHAVGTWSAVCSEAPHSQCGKGARPHLCMDEWNRPTPSSQAVELNPSCSRIAHPNRPGTGPGHKSTEPGSTFTVLRFPFKICPFRGADAKSGKVVQEIPRTWHKRASGS